MGGMRRFVPGAGLGAVLTAATLAVSSVGLAPPAAAAAPPVANPDTAAVLSGQSVTVSPLANDSDPDPGDVLALAGASLVSGSGVVTPSGNDVLIATTPGYVGPLVASYTIVDSTGATADSTITVDVQNNPPVANPDVASMTSGGLLRIDPRSNDTDPDGDALSLTAATATPPEAGTVAVEGGATLLITGTPGFLGPLTVTYTLTDARGAQAQGILAVDVVANRPPATVPDEATVLRGHKVRIPVLANDADPDGDPLTLTKVAKPKRGSASRSGGKVVYKAGPRFVGKVALIYTVRDSHGARSKGTVTVTVTRKKKPPKPPPASGGGGGSASKAEVEKALARLRLPVGLANGRYDARTRRAMCAWRTIVGQRAHRGLPSAAEARAVVAMGDLPRARSYMVTGITVSVTCQTAFWVGADRQYRRVMASCTGKPGYRTRLGTFHIFITRRTWRYSTIYPEARMYKPMQFSGGQALHGSSTDALVKTYPASHGCVRMLHRDVDAMQAGGVGNGTAVRVIGHW